MSIPATILSQVIVTVLVVAFYHWWVGAGKQPQAPPVPAALPAPAALPQISPAVEIVPPEVLAVIAAAIAVGLDGPHRILSVQQADLPAPDVNVWALEGRLQHFLSHKVR
jgi:hypothetical protein